MNDTIEDLIELSESLFLCEDGPPKTFFHIPIAGKEPMRATYVSYVSKAKRLPDLCGWMAYAVLRPLRQKAGEGAFLYWRMTDGFIASRIDDDSLWLLRTRIVVLDKDLNVITLPNVLHKEGALISQIFKEPHRIEDHE